MRICVQDNGCGIASEDLARVTEPFFTTKTDGTGLGLANCRTIVDEARGQLLIHSDPGKGTRVTLLLPMET
jgi:two-component system sensor histidine kinase AtoS